MNAIAKPVQSTRLMQLEADLSRHLSSFYLLSSQYQKHEWLAEKPGSREYYRCFRQNRRSVEESIASLSRRLSYLSHSGEDKASGSAYFLEEKEGRLGLVDMLRRDCMIERRVCLLLEHTRAKAVTLGEDATAIVVEELIQQAEARLAALKEHLELAGEA